MTFPNNDQPDLPFATVGGENFVSPLTGRCIWGYLAFPASVTMPVTAVSLDDGAVVEFEVGAPPPDSGLPIEFYGSGTQEFLDAILKLTWRRG